jgi:cytochrome c oxidase accessory protein FixG
VGPHRRPRLISLALSAAVFAALPFCNILRLDIPRARFHLLGAVLRLDEFHLLFLVLVLALLTIVFVSLVYGRIWCGWLCPQTGLVEAAHLIDRIGGASSSRSLRKGSARTVASFAGRLLRLPLLALLSAGTAWIVVSYFVDPLRTLRQTLAGNLPPVTLVFLAGVGALVFLDLAFWRESFCLRACPYGLMQVLLADRWTQIIRYRRERDDECIHCLACVRCCPMRIDIRESPHQMECIYCAECIDACDAVLGRRGVKGLLEFSYGEEPREGAARRRPRLEPRRMILLGLILLFAVALVTLVETREPVAVSAAGDRLTLYRVPGDGRIYNDYELRLENREPDAGTFRLAARLAGEGGGLLRVHGIEGPLRLAGGEARTLRISLSTADRQRPPGPNSARLLVLDAADGRELGRAEIVFFMPEPAAAKLPSGESREKIE